MKRNEIFTKDTLNQQTIDVLFAKENPTPYEVVLCHCFNCNAYKPGQKSEFFRESAEEVFSCQSDCVLRRFLFGEKFGTRRTPRQRRPSNLTEEQRKAAGERLRLGLQMKNSPKL